MYLEDLEDAKFALEDSRKSRINGRFIPFHPEFDFIPEFNACHLAIIAPIYSASVAYDYRNAIKRGILK